VLLSAWPYFALSRELCHNLHVVGNFLAYYLGQFGEADVMKHRVLVIWVLSLVLLVSGFSLSPQPGADATPTPDAAPRPELRLSVQDSQGFAGGPVFLTVRLLNPDALQTARNAVLLAQSEIASKPPTPGTGDVERSTADDDNGTKEGLSVSGDWREYVRFELTGTVGTIPLEPVWLSSTGHASTQAGVLPLRTTWAIPPELTRDMATGEYTVTARLDTASLFMALGQGKDTEIHDSVRFSLVSPANDAEQALMEEINALYYVGLLDCPLAVAHAMEAVRLDPERVKSYWYAAQCEAIMGNTEEAIALLEDLLARTPPTEDGGEFYAEVRLWLEQLKAGEK
jgi:hypothetical protein